MLAECGRCEGEPPGSTPHVFFPINSSTVAHGQDSPSNLQPAGPAASQSHVTCGRRASTFVWWRPGAAPPLGADTPPTPAATAEWPPRLEAVRVSVPPTIDGRLDDQAWQTPALPLGEWITYNPAYGEKLAQRTEVWVTYDEKHLYFAFRSGTRARQGQGQISAATS